MPRGPRSLTGSWGHVGLTFGSQVKAAENWPQELSPHPHPEIRGMLKSLTRDGVVFACTLSLPAPYVCTEARAHPPLHLHGVGVGARHARGEFERHFWNFLGLFPQNIFSLRLVESVAETAVDVRGPGQKGEPRTSVSGGPNASCLELLALASGAPHLPLLPEPKQGLWSPSGCPCVLKTKWRRHRCPPCDPVVLLTPIVPPTHVPTGRSRRRDWGWSERLSSSQESGYRDRHGNSRFGRRQKRSRHDLAR